MSRATWVTAIAVLVMALPAAGGGGPVYALQGTQAAAILSQVDPVTLRPGARSLRLGSFSAERSRSPDGATLAIVSQKRPRVRFVDLERMRITGQADLAGEGRFSGSATPRAVSSRSSISRWARSSSGSIRRPAR